MHAREGLANKDEFLRALQLLGEHNYLRQVLDPGGRANASEKWAVHPKTCELGDDEL